MAIQQIDVSVTSTSISACAVSGCSTGSISKIAPDSVFGQHQGVLTAGTLVPVCAVTLQLGQRVRLPMQNFGLSSAD